MKIRPVEQIASPEYPDKYNEEIRKVLTSAKPKRWLGAPLATGLLAAAVAMSLSGCVPFSVYTAGAPIPIPDSSIYTDTEICQTTPLPTPTPDILENVRMGFMPIPTSPPDIFDNVTMGEPAVIQSRPDIVLIPLFEYGEGTGAIGCVSIAAPVFLSEEEAFAVISATFAEAGLILDQGGKTLDNVNIPVTSLYEAEPQRDRYLTVQGNMKPDGTLGSYNLPIAFISTQDVENWCEETEMRSSVSDFKVRKTAQTLAENNPGLVVFYDPLARLDNYKQESIEKEDGESDDEFYARWAALEEEESQAVRNESIRLLRQQAEAFIQWLQQ